MEFSAGHVVGSPGAGHRLRLQALWGCWSCGTVRCVLGKHQVLQQSVLLFLTIDQHALHFITGFAADPSVRESRSLKTFKLSLCPLNSYGDDFYYGTMTFEILLC